MLDAIKPLIDNGIINEDTQAAITEAWNSQINEAKEEVRAELREEFARRYDHDKTVMVEALDKMVTDSLTSELKEFADEKQALVEDRVKFKRHMSESASKFKTFMVKNLSTEMKELREDRSTYNNSISKLEKFVVHALAEEIQEFEQDKQAVIETKVKLVAEAKRKLGKLQEAFVRKSAKLVKESVTTNLGSELGQLKEDIQMARENMFGRRIFETFSSEFAVTHLNENKQIAKMQETIDASARKLKEGKRIFDKNQALLESTKRQVKVIQESASRKETMHGLLKTLNNEKASVMASLLENVQTERLQGAYEKYLPSVLSNKSFTDTPAKTGTVLAEGRKVVTGDKSAKESDQIDNNVVELKRLAGLK